MERIWTSLKSSHLESDGDTGLVDNRYEEEKGGRTSKGVRSEWHCRLLCKELGQAAVTNSAFAIRLGLFKRARIFGLRLLARGSIRSGRSPTDSLQLISNPS